MIGRMRTIYRSEPPWPHRVLVLGGGFAGVETAKHLERLTRRRDDVECGSSAARTSRSSRRFCRRSAPAARGPSLCDGTARADAARRRAGRSPPTSRGSISTRKQVTVMGGDGDLHRAELRQLVIALGGETATFGISGITEFAVGMKTLADAFALRNRIIEVLERAELEQDPDQRQAQLTFVVGGARASAGSRPRARSRTSSAACGAASTRRSGPRRSGATSSELNERVLPEMPPEMGAYAAAQAPVKRGYQIHTRDTDQRGPRGRRRHR